MSTVDVHANFVDDLRDQVAVLLKQHGIKVAPAMAAPDVVIQFFDLRHRLIALHPRRAEWSSELTIRAATLPTNLRDGLQAIVEECQAGKDLSRYRSRTWKKPQLQDPLFNDWGIHHFHLGGRHLDRKGFVQRSGSLLYAFFANGAAFLIDVLDHDAFADQDLIQIIHNNWPELIVHAACPDVSDCTEFNMASRKALSRNRGSCNFTLPITVSDGTVYLSVAGALTTSGHNSIVIQRAKDLLTRAHKLEKFARTRCDEIVEAIAHDTGVRLTRLDLHLDISSGNLLLVERSTNVVLRYQD